MDALLIERWLPEGDEVSAIRDEASVALLREAVRSRARERGFSLEAGTELAIVASELAMNHLRHARLGRVGVFPIERDGVAGIEIVAADRGAGIEDPTAAIEGTKPSTVGLGIGLSSVLRLSSEVDVDVRLGEGTCIRARRFTGEVRRRREVGILGRPFEGRPPSGDDAIFLRDDGDLLLALADGLGHGPAARDASAAAIEILAAWPSRDPLRQLDDAHEALVGTRGAVMTLVRIDETAASLTHVGVGNVGAQVAGPAQGSRRFAGPGLVLGMRTAPRSVRVRAEEAPLDPRELVILFSDGLATRTRIERGDPLFLAHPIIVADALLRANDRNNDDATIIVAR